MGIFFESFITDLLVTTASLFALFYWYFNNNYDFWKKRNIPYCQPDAFFGNFKDRFLLRKAISKIWVDLYNELKDHKLGGVWFLKKPMLLVRDPQLIKQILVKDFAHFQDRGMHIDEEKSPLSANLFNMQGDSWRTLRAKLTPTFTSGKMKSMFTLMHKCALEFADYVNTAAKEKNAVEFREVFAKMTTDIIGSCAFGLQLNSMKDPDSEFRAMGRRVFSPSTPVLMGQILYHIFPQVGKFFDFQFPPKDISDFFMKAVKDTVDYREKNKVKRNDFLQLLIELKNTGKIEEGEYDAMINSDSLPKGSDDTDFKFSDNLLAAQAFVFFLAGFETSSTTMSFALHELTMNPDIQAKLREEIDRVLEKTNGEITYDSIRKMEYLDKVLSETLRKYPPIPTLMRKCTKTYSDPESGVYVEKDTAVEIPVYALHHDPAYYPNPEKFDPERFNEEQKALRPNYVYLPFGEGPRICIGMRFGLLQAKLGLTALLSRFEVSVNERKTIPLDPKAFITSFKGGVWAYVTPRAHLQAKETGH